MDRKRAEVMPAGKPAGNIQKSKVVNPAVAPPLSRSENFQVVYADTSKLGYSPWDIRLTFGLLVELEPEKIFNQELVTVILSPAHAKSLQRILNEQIPAFEEQFGTVLDPLAPENTAAIAEAVLQRKENQ